MYQRTMSEILCLYNVEPDLRDVYVEGVTDKRVLDRYFKKYKIVDVSVKTVGDIDFTEIYETYPDIKRNNKKKLILLSEKIDNLYNEDLKGIAIILDRDFDEIKGSLIDNYYTEYSDYNSLELYLFNENVIEIFYRNYESNFPFSARQTIQHITPALVEKFLIRLIIDIKGPFPKDKIIDIAKTAKINKSSGKILFDSKVHLIKILNNLTLIGQQEEFFLEIERYRALLSGDVRKNIRGHDFIHLLFLYFNKIKNNIKLTEEAFEKVILQCIDFSILRNEPLFKKLESKFVQ